MLPREGETEQGTYCLRGLIAVVNVAPMRSFILRHWWLAVRSYGKVRAVEGAAIEHERGLGRGGLLEVDGHCVLSGVEIGLGDLAAEAGAVCLSLCGRRGEEIASTHVEKSVRCCSAPVEFPRYR